MNMRDLRERAGLTQKQAAEQAELDQTHISQFETGKVADPRVSTIDALARVYGVTRDDIVNAIAESVHEASAA